jgi:hypothetical protein
VLVPAGYVPDPLRPLLGILHRLFPFLFNEGGSITLADIPADTPVGLVANLDLLGADLPDDAARKAHFNALLKLLGDVIHDLNHSVNPFADPKLVDRLLAVSKCPDFVVNKGHYFGTDYFKEEPGLTDAEKNDLIAFLKRL